jgi:maltooligosyltrehalose trehalohydrolase
MGSAEYQGEDLHTFEVWAPAAQRVEVKIGDKKFPLEKGAGDWWRAGVAEAGPGTDYAFVLNGEEPAFPDPRSLWQPNGVHGPSRLFDLAAFPWQDAEWHAPPLENAIFYELHIGTFTPQGTFAAAEDRLGYLRDLGITHVELMPVATFPGDRGWGYDGVDLYAPHPAYGGPAALQHFVDASHAAGLAVVLDVVYNHFGPAGNYLQKYAPYITEKHSTPWGGAVNLEEEESDGVRRFFIDNALMWLREYHFDGLRLDAVHALVDRSAIHFLEQLASETRRLSRANGKSYAVIAESDLNDPRLIWTEERGGYGLDAQWSDDFHHALFTVLTGEDQGYYADFGRLGDLAKALERNYVYDGIYSHYRKRQHGRSALGLPAQRFLGYIQNHDQVGNRARGGRLGHIVSLGRAKIAAALVLTSPFVPMLFQGEEFGASSPFQYFTGFEDVELGRLVSAGRKREFAVFGWKPEEIPDPQERSTFETSKLKWDEQTQPPHAELLDWHKKLIQLRKSLPDLAAGAGVTRVQFDEQARWLVVERGKVRVACNLSPGRLWIESGGIEAAEPGAAASIEILLCSDTSAAVDGGRVSLGPDSVAIMHLPSDRRSPTTDN